MYQRISVWLGIVVMGLVVIGLLSSTPISVSAAETAEAIEALKLGQKAKDVEFQPLEGETLKLSELTKQGPVVLVVLRGFPGYQCPICSRQVAELRQRAKDFADLHARVILIYPGPADDLQKRAEEFLRGTELPAPLTLVIDPDYSATTFYGLRWDAPAETAYPSTFVLDRERVVRFRKISLTHGDRAKAADLLKTLREIGDAAAAAGS